jgi:hypothetical protein
MARATFFSHGGAGRNGFLCQKQRRQYREFVTLAITINDLLTRHPPGRKIDLLSIDVEGMDTEIFDELDYEIFRPKAIIAENSHGIRVHEESMRRNKFSFSASTFVNTIYIDATHPTHLRCNLVLSLTTWLALALARGACIGRPGRSTALIFINVIHLTSRCGLNKSRRRGS